jgi:Domain of unknown function (DUF4194)
MDFVAEYPKLEPAQQERFREVVTRLLSGHVLTPGPAMRPDPDWRFAERHRELIDGYLRLGGWRFDIDLGLRLCRAVHESGEQRVRLSKLESLVLCALRLAYHEQMQQVAEDARCELTVGALRERLIHAGKPAWTLSRRAIEQALRRLNRHSLVTIERGFGGEDTETFTVTSLIEKVLPADRIAEMTERVRAYAGAEGGAPPEGALESDEAEAEAGEETA